MLGLGNSDLGIQLKNNRIRGIDNQGLFDCGFGGASLGVCFSFEAWARGISFTICQRPQSCLGSGKTLPFASQLVNTLSLIR